MSTTSSSSLNSFFYPQGVAIFGATNDPAKLGYHILRNLIDSKFNGSIYPMHLHLDSIFELPVYKNILEVPDPVDLAIIALRAEIVSDIIQLCTDRGIKHITVVSGGFAETGREGKELEELVKSQAKDLDVRIIGPNCVGTQNPIFNFNGTFIIRAAKGEVGLVSQSGALGHALISQMNDLNTGLSKFISLGNACDVSVAECVDYLIQDKDTKAIAAYIEGVPDGKQFVTSLADACKEKPVLVVKGGISEQGGHAVASHTGALAGSSHVYSGMFRQIGVQEYSSLEELTYVAKAFSMQPLPKGNRVGIITNAGGAGVLLTDSCDINGLEVISFTETTKKALREVILPFASNQNPVDLVASARYREYKECVEIVLNDDNVDAMIAACVVPTFLPPGEDAALAQGVVDAKKNDKPLLALWMAGEVARHGQKILERAGIPAFEEVRGTSIALSALVARTNFLKSLEGKFD